MLNYNLTFLLAVEPAGAEGYLIKIKYEQVMFINCSRRKIEKLITEELHYNSRLPTRVRRREEEKGGMAVIRFFN